MAASAPVRFIQKSGKTAIGFLELQLRVKPGSSKVREGIVSVGADAVELCVAAQAREGEANKAVVQLLSQVLGVPKTRLQLVRGMKSRDKTVLLDGITGTAEDSVNEVLALLKKASE